VVLSGGASSLHDHGAAVRQSALSESDESPWKPVRWRLECLGHVVVEWLAGVLPGAWAFRLGEWLGALAWHLYPARRKLVMRNLRIAFAGEKPAAELDALARENFRRTGGNLISVAHTARVKPEHLPKVLRVCNLDLLEKSFAQGKGVVLLLSHMGNWELLSRMVHFFPKGASAGAFYRPLNNPILDRRVLMRREADGTRMFSKGDNPLHVAGFLRAGGIVGILADQRVGEKGDLVQFFGRLTRASPLPGLLARRVKCPVLALSLRTVAPGRWEAEFIAVDGPPDTGNCMVALEKAIKASPADVFWMHERWKAYVRPRHAPCDWLENATSAEGRGHRALIWMADVPDGWKPPDAWFHPDVTHELALTEAMAIPAWLPQNTVVHRVEHTDDPHQLAAQIREIDGSHPLPIDYIVTSKSASALRAAGEREQIRVIQLPSA
jgi:Kdo2-lipid IVA lauroyltransferase/acyltransferase